MTDTLRADPQVRKQERVPISVILLFILLLLLTAQNLLAIVLIDEVSADNTIAVKDAYIFIVLAIPFLYGLLRVMRYGRIRRFNQLDVANLLFLVLTTVYLVLPLGHANLFAKLISFRQLIIIPIFYFMGKAFSSVPISAFNKLIVSFAVVVCLFGFLDYFVFGNQFWVSQDIQEYMRQKGMGRWLIGGLPGNFYTFDFINILGTTVRRNVTLLAEPTLSAQYLAYPTLLSFMSGSGILLFPFFLISLLLTLGKGGIGAFFISVFVLVTRRIRGGRRRIALIGFSLFLLALLLVGWYLATSVRNHVSGLINNMVTVIKNPVGLGLGTSGDLAQLYGTASTGTGESYFGALIGQVGVLGGIYYLYLVARTYQLTLKSQGIQYAAAMVISFSTLLMGFLSESAISYVGSGYVFLLLGMYSSSRPENVPNEPR